MQYRHHPGNTLSEYGLLIGLVAVISVASLDMLGKSLANGFGNVNNGLEKDYLSSIFGGGGGTSQVSNTGSGGGSTVKNTGASPSSVLPLNMAASAKTGKIPDFQLSKTSSADSNLTGAEGTQQVLGVKNTINIGLQFAQMAESVTPGTPYYNWLVDASKNSLLMAGNQASYSQNIDGVKGLDAIAKSDLTGAETLRTMHQYYQMLSQAKTEMTSGTVSKLVSSQEKAAGIAMLDSVINNLWTNYSELKDYTYGSAAGINNFYLDVNKLESVDGLGGHMMNQYNGLPSTFVETIRTAAPSVLASGAVDDNSAITASLKTGLSTGSKAAAMATSTTKTGSR